MAFNPQTMFQNLQLAAIGQSARASGIDVPNPTTVEEARAIVETPGFKPHEASAFNKAFVNIGKAVVAGGMVLGIAKAAGAFAPEPSAASTAAQAGGATQGLSLAEVAKLSPSSVMSKADIEAAGYRFSRTGMIVEHDYVPSDEIHNTLTTLSQYQPETFVGAGSFLGAGETAATKAAQAATTPVGKGFWGTLVDILDSKTLAAVVGTVRKAAATSPIAPTYNVLPGGRSDVENVRANIQGANPQPTVAPVQGGGYGMQVIPVTPQLAMGLL